MSNRVNLTLDVTKTGIQNPLIKVRQGDGGFETLRTTVTSNGEPLDLQGWTITFMGTTAGNHKIVDANVTVIEAPNGIFDYTPSKAWGMDIGEFKIAYFKFVKGDGSASSANFRVNVIEAVDLTQEEAKDYISVVDATIAEVREHLETSLADVTDSVAATSMAASSMAVNVSSVASSAVNDINSAASNASYVASSAVSNTSSVASSAVLNVNSAASSAVSDINVAANTYVKKAGDAMTGGLTGGQVELTGTGDLNALTSTGKYVQTNSANASNWTNRPSNAPTTAFFVDVIGSTDETAVTQVYYANSTSRMWVRTLTMNGTNSAWVELANNENVIHTTGAETIADDKTFTGTLIANGMKVSGDDYKNLVSGSANYFGVTISFVRIGKQVTFTSSANAFNTSVAVGLTNNVLPNGFKPALQQNVDATNQDGANKFFSFDPSGSVYSYSAYTSGTQPRISGTYITTDAWPV